LGKCNLWFYSLFWHFFTFFGDLANTFFLLLLKGISDWVSVGSSMLFTKCARQLCNIACSIAQFLKIQRVVAALRISIGCK
jgi:hypothetical protein